MSRGRKWLLGLFLAAVTGVILGTWGSIGSAILTLAMILVVSFLLLKKTMDAGEEFMSDD